jgi:predicted anti-sigma-YlaC factor YlaD
MMSSHPWRSRDARLVALGHVSDARLNDTLDGRVAGDERVVIDTHIASCASCAARWRGLEAVVALGALERATKRSSPDQWPVIAACTVYERRLRRHFARRSRRRLYLSLLLATIAGALFATGLVRVALGVARAGGWVAAQAAAWSPPLRVVKPRPPAANVSR